MADVDDLVREDIDDLGQALRRFRRGKVAALEMGVSMEMVARLRDTDQPIDGF